MRAFEDSGQRGLYDPAYEHDACGVGAVCRLDGGKSHDVIQKGLEILENLTHRGACGCDATTGDGAGILMQVPHAFLADRCGEIGVRLPDLGEYGVGMVFLPTDAAQRKVCMDRFADVVEAEGQSLLGWRDVPTVSDALGDVARRAEPVIKQVFIGRGAGLADAAAFERKLYVIRKVMEGAIRGSDLTQREAFYVSSLSSRKIVYKGLLLANQVPQYYPDLTDPTMVSGLALVHQRYSTNTFPTWPLAQPFRFLCHNGEINTLRGNANWMHAREALFESPLFGDDIAKLSPIVTPGASDSAVLDNAVELLYHTGRSLPHAVMMLIPEAWQHHATMSDEKKAFYEYHSCLMEPWDGPASIPFSDGQCVGAVLDRNGLRPSRYTVTKDGYVVMGSETGVLEIAPANVEMKGRLEPGRMFLVDFEQGRIIDDDEIKSEMSGRKPYRTWLRKNHISVDALPEAAGAISADFETITDRQNLFGYTLEDLKVLLGPMAVEGKEPTGSMGNDTPLAVLSDRPQLLYNYFKQLFAQVTNPPLDGIREALVTSLATNIGAERDLFEETPEHCRLITLSQPILTNDQLERIRGVAVDGIKATTLDIVFPVAEGAAGLERALDRLFAQASESVRDGHSVLILSDRKAGKGWVPIPSLLAVAGLHHHLIREQLRTRCGLVLESGEPREVHHFCVLFGYGCSAVNPYLAMESIEQLIVRGELGDLDAAEAIEHYIKAIGLGVLKTMSKMGISTLHSYRGAQNFEALGLSSSVTDHYFTRTPSRIEGIGLETIAAEALARYARAYPAVDIADKAELERGGQYQWRRDGEYHLFNPVAIAQLQESVRGDNVHRYKEFAETINDQSKRLGTLRGLLTFKRDSEPIGLDEVEPWTEIVKRFKTGAMSYGSISEEAHSTLAIAMNRLGGRSNSGEGGEDPARFEPDAKGDSRCSAIKQVASGRFGVTIDYLIHANELQIKMAQGAKPGEGGQLPGNKVFPWIAKTRHSTPWVQLISPPPHHDIYSIEDLAQLIHDLKNANRDARINVKLVSVPGVGTVAAGVSKGKADVVLISGHDGGTGASPQSSIKHAGLPWELGVAETHQTLLLNDLRSRIVVECDGQLKTGRDVAIACLLGAEEFGFATAPLITVGCVMMRKCHLNTCPVGVATQDPELRKHFAGKPEHVINYFHFVAEELREIMASLGLRTIDEMVGHVEKLEVRKDAQHWKAKMVDLSAVLYRPEVPAGVGARCLQKQDHGLEAALDHELIRQAEPALARGERVEIDINIRNVNRTVGTMLSSEVAKRHGGDQLPDDTIVINATGSAGQSFCAFGAKGITMRVQGDGNDYFGKGLSGAKLIVRPADGSTFDWAQTVLIGNVAAYGATSGELYVAGRAGERFCVRNSGVQAVVEGVGDHGCEYMTGGRVVVLGPTGRNFAAGMSGGVAYVVDEDGDFARYRCNTEMVDLEPLTNAEEIEAVHTMIANHVRHTGSPLGRRMLACWDDVVGAFVKVMPRDYKRALAQLAQDQADASVGLAVG